MMKEILKVGIAAVIGSWIGDKVTPMIISKFADAGSMSAGTATIAKYAVSGLAAGAVYHFAKV